MARSSFTRKYMYKTSGTETFLPRFHRLIILVNNNNHIECQCEQHSRSGSSSLLCTGEDIIIIDLLPSQLTKSTDSEYSHWPSLPSLEIYLGMSRVGNPKTFDVSWCVVFIIHAVGLVIRSRQDKRDNPWRVQTSRPSGLWHES